MSTRNLNHAQFPEYAKNYEGTEGSTQHITRVERGMIPVGHIAGMHGAAGEVPGEHRNYQGADWGDFKGRISREGIRNPVFITVDYGKQPRMSEGNSRRDAAVELGHTHVPAEVKYYGHAERTHKWGA